MPEGCESGGARTARGDRRQQDLCACALPVDGWPAAFCSRQHGDVLVALHRAGEPIDVNQAAIGHLLHDGFVPPPLTVYRDVFGISVDLQAAGAEFRDNCRRLGLRHDAHLFDPRDRRTRTDLIAHAWTIPQPCADPALTACVSLVRRLGTPGGVILDGSGNDYYSWRPPRRLDLVQTWLGRLGLGRLPMFRGASIRKSWTA